jgi:hypothetical protein
MPIITSANLESFMSDDSADNATERGYALNAANTWVPQYCNRSFDVAGSASARVFVPQSAEVLRIDDCTSITSISNNGATVSASAFQLEPLNGLDAAGQARPYDVVRLTSGWWYCDGRRATVSVNAAWGWAAVPAQVFEATLILAADLYSNRDKRYGIVTTTEFAGVRARQNPVVTDLLAPFRKATAWGLA